MLHFTIHRLFTVLRSQNSFFLDFYPTFMYRFCESLFAYFLLVHIKRGMWILCVGFRGNFQKEMKFFKRIGDFLRIRQKNFSKPLGFSEGMIKIQVHPTLAVHKISHFISQENSKISQSDSKKLYIKFITFCIQRFTNFIMQWKSFQVFFSVSF